MRIQEKYFCFASASFLAIFIMLYMLWATPSDNEVGMVFWGLAGAMEVCVFVYNTYKTILWTSRARQFKKAFGINPPDDPREIGWKVRGAIQPIVDEYLKAHANDLQMVYDAENKLLKKKPENLEQAMGRAKKIVTQTASVESEKNIFWSEHHLAWEWGFEVWSSHTDYITSAVYRISKEKTKKKF